MRIGSLFSGYGGLDLAALQLFPGTSVAWHCEWDDAPAMILNHHWPTVPNHRDVTTLDWTTVEPVDILTGGYPCQPFSAAGQRKGTDDERHLWPYVRDAIRILRPRFTLLENVAGHRSLGFDRVLGDLAEDGMHSRRVHPLGNQGRRTPRSFGRGIVNLWRKLKRWWFLEDYYPYENWMRYDPVSGEPRPDARNIGDTNMTDKPTTPTCNHHPRIVCSRCPRTPAPADEHQPMVGMGDVQCTCLKWRGNDHSRHRAALEGEQQ